MSAMKNAFHETCDAIAEVDYQLFRVFCFNKEKDEVMRHLFKVRNALFELKIQVDPGRATITEMENHKLEHRGAPC